MAVIHSPQLAAGVGPRPGWSAADDVDASAAPAPTCARARDPMLEGRTGSGREPFPSLGAAAWLEQQQHQHRQQRQQPYTQLSPNRNHHQLRNHAPGCNSRKRATDLGSRRPGSAARDGADTGLLSGGGDDDFFLRGGFLGLAGGTSDVPFATQATRRDTSKANSAAAPRTLHSGALPAGVEAVGAGRGSPARAGATQRARQVSSAACAVWAGRNAAPPRW